MNAKSTLSWRPLTIASRLGSAFALLAMLIAFGGNRVQAQLIAASIDSAYYGWLDQYSMNAAHNFVGDEACVPTSSTNGMTLLQNLYPSVYGTALTGGNYTTWMDTDHLLISSAYMNTTVGDGTYYYRMVYGLQDYIVTTKGFTQTLFAGIMPNDYFDPPTYPRPAFITDGKPTADFIYNSLFSGSMTFFSIEYVPGGGGHGLLAQGISWNSTTGTGTLSFIDPLDPSVSYTGNIGDGPAKVTTGTIELKPSGYLELTYDQYEGGLPFSPGDFSTIHANIDTVFAVTVPEPSLTLMVATLGGLGLLAHRCRRQRRG